jgi:hypothetical protein
VGYIKFRQEVSQWIWIFNLTGEKKSWKQRQHSEKPLLFQKVWHWH